MKSLPLAVSLLIPGIAISLAQEVTLKVETRVVEINVSVKDAAGRTVRGLRKEDFTVTDNGNRRDIAIFAGEEEPAPSTPPVRLPEHVFSNRYSSVAASRRITAILLDGVNGAFEFQSFARQQAIRAIGRMNLGESIALYSMTPELSILQDYTTDRDRLLDALQRFVPRQPRMPDTGGAAPNRAERRTLDPSEQSARPRRRDPLSEFLMRERVDTTLQSLITMATHMGSASGRKSILWITGGFPPNTDYNNRIDAAVSAINEANVAVYPVDARGLLVGSGAAINIQTMQRFAESTGGQAYYNRNDVDREIEEAVEDSRYTYALGFYLTDKDLDGRFHELKVSAARPGLTLHYRRGYSADRPVETAVKGKQDPLEAELLNPVDSTGVRMDARVDPATTKEGRMLRVVLMIDPTSVSLTDGMKLTEMFVQTDASGRVLGKVTESVKVKVSPDKPPGGYLRTIPLREGALKLQIVVRDNDSGHTGSLTIPLN